MEFENNLLSSINANHEHVIVSDCKIINFDSEEIINKVYNRMRKAHADCENVQNRMSEIWHILHETMNDEQAELLFELDELEGLEKSRLLKNAYIQGVLDATQR